MVDRIIALIKEKGLSIYSVEKKLGFGNGAIKRFDNNSPSIDKIILLSDFLNTSIDYLIYGEEKRQSLSDNEIKLIKHYKRLPHDEKISLISRAEAIADVYEKRGEELKPNIISICCSQNRVSAGIGEELLDYEQWNTVDVIETPQSRKADFMLIVGGESMSPKFHDGDYVLVRQQPAVELGQIGIFYVDGKGYIKKYDGDYLISLNPDFDDIYLTDKDFRCFGLVLGIAELAEKNEG